MYFLMCQNLKNTSRMLKYEYEYDEIVELSIYHLTLQRFCLIFANLLKFLILLNIENFNKI